MEQIGTHGNMGVFFYARKSDCINLVFLCSIFVYYSLFKMGLKFRGVLDVFLWFWVHRQYGRTIENTGFLGWGFSTFRGWDFSMYRVRFWGQFVLNKLTKIMQKGVIFLIKLHHSTPCTVYTTSPSINHLSKTLEKWGLFVSFHHTQTL